MRPGTLFRATALAISTASILTSCGGDSTGTTAVPSSISAVENVEFNGTAGEVLSPSPTFVVRDAQGNALGGVPVTVVVTSGTARIANAATVTSASGPTPIGTITIGEKAGPSTISVTVSGLPVLTITVTGAAGPPAKITDANAPLNGFAGAPVIVSLVVRDKFGNPIPGITVSVAVTEGGGSVAPATATGGTDGRVPTIVWTFGKSAVPQTLVATGAGITSTVAGTVSTSYPLDLRFFGPPLSPEALASFNAAAARIRGSITGALSVVAFPDTINVKTSCGGPDQGSIGTTSGIIIYASVDSIDGPSHILAQSGPCFVRTSSGLPVLAVMKFDRDDIAGLVSSGRLANVVLHEMLHAVGVGTVWSRLNLLTGKGGDDPRFTGQMGISACNEAGGNLICATGVPVENCLGLQNCGAGTQDSHWRESVFDAELMTGFVEPTGVPMPFSKITIQSLGDFGYNINTLASDPYTIPPPALSASLQLNVGPGSTAPPVVWESTVTPKFMISGNRSVRRIPE